LRRAGDPLLFQTASVFKAIEQDLAAGRLKHAEPDWRETLRMAEDLSAARTEGLGTAAVDIWHICAAQILGAEVFWTFDEVQQRLAADCIKRVPRLPTA